MSFNKMQKQKLVTSMAASGWSGRARGMNNSVQQVTHRYQVREGNYNAGTHYGFEVNCAVPKHGHGVGTDLGECYSGMSADDGHIELSVAKNLRHIIGVRCKDLMRLVSHCSSSNLKQAFLALKEAGRFPGSRSALGCKVKIVADVG